MIPDEFVTIRMTREAALALGLLICQCGFPSNNHFNHAGPCAFSNCNRYRETARVGKLVLLKGNF